MMKILFFFAAFSAWIAYSSTTQADPVILSYHEDWAVMVDRDDYGVMTCTAFFSNPGKDVFGHHFREDGRSYLQLMLGAQLQDFSQDQSIATSLYLVLDRQEFILRNVSLRAGGFLYDFQSKDEAMQIIQKLYRSAFATMYDASGTGEPIAAWNTNGGQNALHSMADCFNRIYRPTN